MSLPQQAHKTHKLPQLEGVLRIYIQMYGLHSVTNALYSVCSEIAESKCPQHDHREHKNWLMAAKCLRNLWRSWRFNRVLAKWQGGANAVASLPNTVDARNELEARGRGGLDPLPSPTLEKAPCGK